jgi:hypothetical protein
MRTPFQATMVRGDESPKQITPASAVMDNSI